MLGCRFMKKFISCILSLVILFAFSAQSFSNCAEAAQTSSKTPAFTSELLFSKQFGSNFRNSPTTPVVVDDTLIVVSGQKLYKLNAKTGDVISSMTLESKSPYAVVPPLYVNGVVYVQIYSGIVQAVDYDTMKSLWIYNDELGGQALCPITYSDGFIYTGFWNKETEYANFVCLSATDENTKSENEEKKATWTYKALGGFYWAGACVYGDYIIFGKDDGQDESEADSEILCLDKKSGKKISSLKTKGDIRSSVVYCDETDSFYVSGKSGYVLKFSLNSSGKLCNEKYFYADGEITSSPVIYNGRLYVGASKEKIGEFIVLDAEKMTKIYSADMLGYPQSTALVSTGYEKKNGKVYIYMTYNKNPGGITVFEDRAGQSEAVQRELFEPQGSCAQYCLSSVVASVDGTLYYQNDSGYIFAVNDSHVGLWEYLMNLIAEFIKFCNNLSKLISINY